VVLASVLFYAEILIASDSPGPSEAQVKAAFLFNFAKYVDWPASALPKAAAPMTIGVIGTGPLGDCLNRAMQGKEIRGRPYAIKRLAFDAELSGCQILFISHSETARMAGILERAGALPVLTVGEDEIFGQSGGIIEFVLKNGNVRLEIDLSAARKAGLTISSRLLAVADAVRGKNN
jgi:hypothetical protein